MFLVRKGRQEVTSYHYRYYHLDPFRGVGRVVQKNGPDIFPDHGGLVVLGYSIKCLSGRNQKIPIGRNSPLTYLIINITCCQFRECATTLGKDPFTTLSQPGEMSEKGPGFPSPLTVPKLCLFHVEMT